MQLTDEQKAKVSTWIQEGAKLSEIQDRLAKEFEIRLTYMVARLLVDDLKLTPKDIEPPHPPAAPPADAPPAQASPAPALSPLDHDNNPAPAIGGKLALTVDQIARPGAMASGKVTFSDGQKAEWQMDQYGRLGLTAAQAGYRPPQSDIAEFQVALDRELARLGM